MSSPPTPPAPPRPALPFRGRQTELDALNQRLASRGGLVVLWGTGGVGKSRLAVEAAQHWQSTHAGTAWIELQSARDPDDVNLRVAQAIGARRAEDVPQRLRELSRALLVLDNLEQLPDEAFEAIAGWAREAPSLRILGTSRRRLHVAEAEHVALDPWPVPDEATVFSDPAWAVLQDCAGRALRVPASAAVQLLQRLDGLPLALLLAAARLEVLSEDDLLQRLSAPLAVLVDPSRPHARHGSLTQALAWSWSMMSPSDRDTLPHLAAFRGPFDLTLAEALLPDDKALVDRIQRAVRAHILIHDEGQFRFPVPARAYARELLGSAGWQRAVHQHVRAIDAWLDQHGTQIPRPSLVTIQAELRAVLDRADLLDASEMPSVLRAGDVLSRHVMMHLGVDAMHTVAQSALAHATAAPEEARWANTLQCYRGLWHRSHSRFDEARAAYEVVLTSATPGSQSHWIALEGRAVCAMLTGDLAQAVDLLEAFLSMEGASMEWEVRIRSLLAESLAHLGHHARASAEIRRIQADAAELPHSRLVLMGLTAAGGAAAAMEELSLSIEMFTDALGIAQALNSPLDEAILQGRIARVRMVAGEVDEGLAAIADSIEALHALGQHLQAHSYGIDQARTLAILGRWEAAREALVGAEEHVPQRRWDVQSLLRLSHAVLGLPPPPIADGHDSKVFDALVAGFSRHRTAVHDSIAQVHAALTDSGFASEWVKVTESGRRALAHRASTWRVAADGAWFESPDGARVSLARRRAYARVLAYLVERRHTEPGVGSGVEALFAAGWPGETAQSKSAANRVHVALSSLRKLGLEPLVVRDRTGWRLDDDTPVVSVDS